MKNAIQAVGRFVYKYSGMKAVVEKVQEKVFHYKLRLRMVPVTYKAFLLIVGATLGSTMTYIYIQAPKVYLDLMSSEKIIVVNEVHAQEVKEQPKEEGTDIDEIVKNVYQLESSSGKNDSCRAKGLYNGYGYGWYNGKKPCYASHEEVTALVKEWFNDKLKDLTVEEALCVYNTGGKDKCEYLGKYNKM